MRKLSGQCHCGSVTFEIASDLHEITTCDCSLCTVRNALMVKVPDTHLTLLSGEEFLTLYQWNMKIARHYFCKMCGIYVFHNKRAAPDHFGVNVLCLNDIDLSDIPVRATEGENMTVSQVSAKPHWPGPRI